MWLTAGDLVASQAGTASDPVDVLFELLRLEQGTFIFKEGEADASLHPEPIAPVLDKATERLAAWRIIAAVVPSLSVGTGLSAELPVPSVMLTAERWRALVAVAAAKTVGDIASRMGLNEFNACKLVKELVDDGLVVVAIAEPPGAEAEHEHEQKDDADADAEDELDDELDDVDEPEDEAEVADADAEDEHEDEDDDVEDGVADDELDDADHSEEGDVADGGQDDLDGEEDAGDRLSALSMAAARMGGLPEGAGSAEGGVDGEFDGEFVGDGDEPINRGLLLKFLSSVRS
jgi:hypothetical protein